MNLKPIGKRLLIKVEKEVEKSKSGLILQMQNETNDNYGIILEKSDEINDLKIGDKVIFDKLKSVEVRRSGNIYYITNLDDIYAVIGGKNE